MLNESDYIVGTGDDARVRLGAFFEILLVITNIGTRSSCFPSSDGKARASPLGYVASRIVEGAAIVIGLISLLAILTLRDDFAGAAGADADSLLVTGESLIAIHDWSFLIGPGFCVGIGNGLILGYLMYRSGLVPRQMAMLGLIGGPLIFASGIAVLLGAYEQTEGMHFLFSIPEIAWEASLGVYLIVKGFKPSPSCLDDRRPQRA